MISEIMYYTKKRKKRNLRILFCALCMSSGLLVFAGEEKTPPKCDSLFPEATCFHCEKSFIRNDRAVQSRIKDRKLLVFKDLSKTRYANYSLVDSKYSEELFRYGSANEEMRLECFEGTGLTLVKTVTPPSGFLLKGELDKRRDVSKFWLEEASKLFKIGSEITTLSDAFLDGMRSAEHSMETPLGFTQDYRGFYASRNIPVQVHPLKDGRVELQVLLFYQEAGE
jgi:hypothetical protein